MKVFEKLRDASQVYYPTMLLWRDEQLDNRRLGDKLKQYSLVSAWT